MPKPKKTKSSKESDKAFFFKIVMYLILGSQWLYLTDPLLTKQIPIPIGLFIGFLFISHEHFQIDKKVEFAILAIACLMGLWANFGFFINIL